MYMFLTIRIKKIIPKKEYILKCCQNEHFNFFLMLIK